MLWLWLYRRTQRRLAMLIRADVAAKAGARAPTSAFYARILAGDDRPDLVGVRRRPAAMGRKDEKVFTRGRSLMIALDVSRSMLATIHR